MSNGECSTNRYTGERPAEKRREAEITVSGHKPRSADSCQKLEEAENGISLEPLEGAQPCWYLQF